MPSTESFGNGTKLFGARTLSTILPIYTQGAKEALFHKNQVSAHKNQVNVNKNPTHLGFRFVMIAINHKLN